MKNISLDKYGYRIEAMRNGIQFASFVKFDSDRAAALKKAIAIRDDFVAKCAAVKARNKTGVAGVVELVHWSSGCPQPCFVVTHGKPCRNWKKRFFYRTFSERNRQFVNAIHHRARLSGEKVEELLNNAREALAL